MLTPANIKNHHFQNLGRGFYKTDEVDNYIDEIYSSYNLVYNENKELIRKLNILASKIEEYRNDEQSIRNAIINAQRMASKLINEARKEAESIIEAAETKAESADSITNIRIQKRIDEVEQMIRETFDKARTQAKKATEKAENDAKAVITDAKIKASEIIENAAKTSRNQLAVIVEDINSQQSVLAKLKEESETFKNTMIKRYEDQITLIRSITDFALNEIDDKYNFKSSEDEVTKNKVDEIIESIFKEKLSSFDEFSASIKEDEYDGRFFSDKEMTFEDIYSSSDSKNNLELSQLEDVIPDFYEDAKEESSFDDIISSVNVSDKPEIKEEPKVLTPDITPDIKADIDSGIIPDLFKDEGIYEEPKPVENIDEQQPSVEDVPDVADETVDKVIKAEEPVTVDSFLDDLFFEKNASQQQTAEEPVPAEPEISQPVAAEPEVSDIADDSFVETDETSKEETVDEVLPKQNENDIDIDFVVDEIGDDEFVFEDENKVDFSSDMAEEVTGALEESIDFEEGSSLTDDSSGIVIEETIEVDDDIDTFEEEPQNDKPFSISFDESNPLEDTFEFDFIDDDE